MHELTQSFSFSACVDKCFGAAWVFQCQLWLWSSLLKNVRRYSWALIDLCGTKVKHEAVAHPLTNCLLHSAKHKQVFYSAGSGEDLSTMLKGNLKTWAEEKWSFRGGCMWKHAQGSSVSHSCLWSPPAVHVFHSFSSCDSTPLQLLL